MDFDLHRYDEVTSTNELVKQAIVSGAHEGYCVCANRQSGGYGRRGNSWASDIGGLYFSLLLRPDNMREVATLSLAIAVAIRRALASFLPEDAFDCIQIKWPNDVVVDRRRIDFNNANSKPFRLGARGVSDDFKFNKICGISLECIHGAVCIGIGINIDPPQVPRDSMLFKASKNIPCYLNELLCTQDVHRTADSEAIAHVTTSDDGKSGYGLTLNSAAIAEVAVDEMAVDAVTIDVVLERLLADIEDVYAQWERSSFESLRAEFLDHSALNDLDICVDNTGLEASVCGRAVDVDSQGHLIVKTDDGRLIEIAAGTITIRR